MPRAGGARRGAAAARYSRARIDPPECPLFATACTPATPVGACMVSSEGTCAAWYRHERLATGGARVKRPDTHPARPRRRGTAHPRAGAGDVPPGVHEPGARDALGLRDPGRAAAGPPGPDHRRVRRGPARVSRRRPRVPLGVRDRQRPRGRGGPAGRAHLGGDPRGGARDRPARDVRRRARRARRPRRACRSSPATPRSCPAARATARTSVTAGLGVVPPRRDLGDHRMAPGDAVAGLRSARRSRRDHRWPAATSSAARRLRSDCAPLAVPGGGAAASRAPRSTRCTTRPAAASPPPATRWPPARRVRIVLEQTAIPVRPQVASGVRAARPRPALRGVRGADRAVPPRRRTPNGW